MARTAIKWQDIVNLLQANSVQLFNDKAFIIHLVYNPTRLINIQRALKLLNEDSEIISAVAKELRGNSDQYRYITNEIIPVLINLAKKSELPSQLEQLNIKASSFKA